MIFFLHPSSYPAPPALFFHLFSTQAGKQIFSVSCNHAWLQCAWMLRLNDASGIYNLDALRQSFYILLVLRKTCDLKWFKSEVKKRVKWFQKKGHRLYYRWRMKGQAVILNKGSKQFLWKTGLRKYLRKVKEGALTVSQGSVSCRGSS